MGSKYPELDGLTGKEYNRAYNRLHHEKCKEAYKRWRKLNPKGVYNAKRYHIKQHAKVMSEKGKARTTSINDGTKSQASNSYKKWEYFEDQLLLDKSLTSMHLTSELKRTLRSIEYRRYKLKHNLI